MSYLLTGNCLFLSLSYAILFKVLESFGLVLEVITDLLNASPCLLGETMGIFPAG